MSILEQKIYKRNIEFYNVKVENFSEIKGKTDEVHLKILCSMKKIKFSLVNITVQVIFKGSFSHPGRKANELSYRKIILASDLSKQHSVPEDYRKIPTKSC